MIVLPLSQGAVGKASGEGEEAEGEEAWRVYTRIDAMRACIDQLMLAHSLL